MNKPILLLYLENNFFKAFILLILWSSAVFWLFQQYHITLVILGLLWIGLKHIHNWLTHLIAALIPISLMWILYHTVTQAWWLADDPTFLQSIIEHGIFSHFYQSEMWRSLIFGTN
ncbi:membrane protein [Candidatus Thiomargarita nelsonii]|uniref:Membrane protein n=1 Tax=Candidatus Thiomargarita nelsonii TaxID=1003181 RepID=A0A176RST6_9GAMM|nr:membrane protein [Candidatus Thiomargarita nelsonii]